MDIQWSMTSVASVIQISVAPVFLLAGISALLGVMTNRLARVIDRTRVLQRGLLKVVQEDHRNVINREVRKLHQRGRLINSAINCATISALLVCLVIMSLFLGSLINVNVAELVASLFVICMAVLIIGLLMFLGEVFIATHTMRKGLAETEQLISVDTSATEE